jgi:hypothetical protein
MKRLLCLCIVFLVSLTTLLAAQSTGAGSGEQSTSYTMGYYIGSFLGRAWPFIVFAIVAYVIYRLVKRKKTAA